MTDNDERVCPADDCPCDGYPAKECPADDCPCRGVLRDKAEE